MLKIECLELNKFYRPYSLDPSLVKEVETSLDVEDVSSSNRMLVLRKAQLLVDDVSFERLYNVEQELEHMYLLSADGKTVEKELSFASYSWNVNLLNITLSSSEQDFTSRNLKLVFKTRKISMKKNDLAILPADKTSHPFILLVEDGVEIQEKFYYIHNQVQDDTVDFYFKNPLDSSKSYMIYVVDYFNIYDFSVKEVNKFDKTLNVGISSYKNYDGDMPLANCIMTIENEEGEILASIANQSSYSYYDFNSNRAPKQPPYVDTLSKVLEETNLKACFYEWHKFNSNLDKRFKLRRI